MRLGVMLGLCGLARLVLVLNLNLNLALGLGPGPGPGPGPGLGPSPGLLCLVTALPGGHFELQLTPPLPQTCFQLKWEDAKKMALTYESSVDERRVQSVTNQTLILKECVENPHFTAQCPDFVEVTCSLTCGSLTAPPTTAPQTTAPLTTAPLSTALLITAPREESSKV